MRLAVVADIHGNLLALEAVLADLSRRGVDRVVNLGDCVSGPLWPRETASLLIDLDWPTVRGNHDRWVTDQLPDRRYPSDSHAYAALEPAQLEWLKGLPSCLELENGVFACHGRPDDDNAYLLENVKGGQLVLAPLDELRSRVQAIKAQFLLCGHSHVRRQVAIDGMTVVNPGSVGQPAYSDPTSPAHVSESGSPFARYCIIDLNHDQFLVESIVVPYNHAAAAERAKANGSLSWAHSLMTGFVL